MLDDPYKISSNFRPSKGATECNVKEFYGMFEEFYIKLNSKQKQNKSRKMRKRYAFALLCKDSEPLYDSDDNDHHTS